MFQFLLRYLVSECRLWYFGKMNKIWDADMSPVGHFLRRPLISVLSSRNSWDIIETLYVICVSMTFKVTLMCVHISEWVCFFLMKTCVFLDHWHPRVNCLRRCVPVCVLNSCSLEGIQVSGEEGWTNVMCVWVCRVGILKLLYPLTLIGASQMWPWRC